MTAIGARRHCSGPLVRPRNKAHWRRDPWPPSFRQQEQLRCASSYNPSAIWKHTREIKFPKHALKGSSRAPPIGETPFEQKHDLFGIVTVLLGLHVLWRPRRARDRGTDPVIRENRNAAEHVALAKDFRSRGRPVK